MSNVQGSYSLNGSTGVIEHEFLTVDRIAYWNVTWWLCCSKAYAVWFVHTIQLSYWNNHIFISLVEVRSTRYDHNYRITIIPITRIHH